MSHEISVYITGKRNRMGENLTYIDVCNMCVLTDDQLFKIHVVSLKFNKCTIILNMTLSTGKYFTDKSPLSYLDFISFMSN